MQRVVTAAPVERRFSTTEYHRMGDAGLFIGERVQLLDGKIIHMSPQGAPHGGATQYLDKALKRLVGDRAEVRVQLPLAIRDGTEPEPDIAVCAPGAYRAAHPATALLVIEVADSSIALDRQKAATYASAGVPEYWIVNLPDRVVELYLSPSPSGYANVTVHAPGETLRIAAFPDVELTVADVLG